MTDFRLRSVRLHAYSGGYRSGLSPDSLVHFWAWLAYPKKHKCMIHGTVTHHELLKYNSQSHDLASPPIDSLPQATPWKNRGKGISPTPIDKSVVNGLPERTGQNKALDCQSIGGNNALGNLHHRGVNGIYAICHRWLGDSAGISGSTTLSFYQVRLEMASV